MMETPAFTQRLKRMSQRKTLSLLVVDEARRAS